jgi:hypothetical protein
MRVGLYSTLLSGFGLGAVGCLEEAPQPADGAAEGIVVALSYSESDVSAVRFDIVTPEDGCAGTVLASETVVLSDGEAAPVAGHAHASALIVLAPGNYRVCAVPLSGAGPSLDCAPVDGLATVVAEQTSELTLVSQCLGDPAGGLAPVLSLNKPPRIDAVTADPATYLTVCETLDLTVGASDPEGDTLSYVWSVLEGSPAAHLSGEGESARFSGPEGDYRLGVTVRDVHNAQTSLSFDVSVARATCQVPAAVHDIMVAKCAPCHITGASGGLSLATPQVAYQSLVLSGVASSLCSTQVRVVPGDASASYLMAKLLGTDGICGVQMPRGRPPLPQEELDAIAAWIDDLPLP